MYVSAGGLFEFDRANFRRRGKGATGLLRGARRFFGLAPSILLFVMQNLLKHWPACAAHVYPRMLHQRRQCCTDFNVAPTTSLLKSTSSVARTPLLLPRQHYCCMSVTVCTNITAAPTSLLLHEK